MCFTCDVMQDVYKEIFKSILIIHKSQFVYKITFGFLGNILFA
jgi:hypothetical protein